MTIREKFLIFWVFAGMASSFLVSHFFGGAVSLLENVIALGLGSVTGLAHFFAVHL